jgi:hypothetical protein
LLEELCKAVVVVVALALGVVAVVLALVVLAFSLASVFCTVTGCETLGYVGGTSVADELCGVVVLVTLAFGVVAVLAFTLALVVLAFSFSFSFSGVLCTITGCEAFSYIRGTSVVEDCGSI